MRFLKHIERTRLIAHLVDTSDANDRDPVHDFEIIEHELAAFSPALAEKPMIVVATKLDATTDRTHLDELREFAPSAASNFTRSRPRTAKALLNWCAPWPTRSTGFRSPPVPKLMHPDVTCDGGASFRAQSQPEPDMDSTTHVRRGRSLTSHAVHKSHGRPTVALGGAFRRHVRSDSRGPYRGGAGGAKALSSRRDLFHRVVAPAA